MLPNTVTHLQARVHNGALKLPPCNLLAAHACSCSYRRRAAPVMCLCTHLLLALFQVE